jgi:hypothetical protein
MSYKICFICHSVDSIKYIFNTNKFLDFSIIFVGDKELTTEYLNNSNIIIARNFSNNIENEKQFLTFTAWYLIVKNNLFSEYKYIFMFEWDIYIKKEFTTNIKSAISSDLDIISFSKNEYYFFHDINVNVFKYYLKTKNIDPFTYNDYSYWLPSTNHGIKRDVLVKFVDWYYPSCFLIDKLNSGNISWYHERLFFVYIDFYKLAVGVFNGVQHMQNNSHCSFNKRQDMLPPKLVDLYINNDNCDFLNALISHYDVFNKVFQKCNHEFTQGCGSYLFEGQHYLYSEKMYEKQKLLFETAKISTSVLEIGVYLGHSLFIMLLANPNLKITCIDIEDKYNPAIKFLEEYFNVTIHFIKNDSRTILPTLNEKFDLFHIDSLHDENHVLFEFNNTTKNIDTTKNLVHYVFNDCENYPKTIKQIMNGNLVNNYMPVSIQKSQCQWNNAVIKLMRCNSELEKLAGKHGTDKFLHGYIPIYEEYINLFKTDVFNFLEIGVFFGSSINMWTEYLKNAIIYGADTFEGNQGNGNKFDNANLYWNEVMNSNDEKYKNIELIKLDQSSEAQIQKFQKKMIKTDVKFKIILDDGSHLMKDQQLSFFYLFDLIEDGGIYIIEDLHSSDQDNYDLFPDKSNSTKKLFENIKNGDIFKSAYINDPEKCKQIAEDILELKFFKIKEGSEVLLIFKK